MYEDSHNEDYIDEGDGDNENGNTNNISLHQSNFLFIIISIR